MWPFDNLPSRYPYGSPEALSARYATVMAEPPEDVEPPAGPSEPLVSDFPSYGDVTTGIGRVIGSLMIPPLLRSSFSTPVTPVAPSNVQAGSVEPQRRIDIGGGVMRTLRPSEATFASEVPPVQPAPGGIDETLGLGAPASYAPTRMRAIRMPDGKLLFTNRDEYGGEEFTPAEGGRLVREAQRAQPLEATNPLVSDPTSRTLRALVRASAGRPESGPVPAAGRMVPGTTPDLSGGTLSTIEGTPQQQQALQLEDAIGALSLANVRQETEVASMPAAQRELLQNRDVQVASFLINRFLPQIQQKQADTELKMRMISTPGDPQFIRDERQRTLRAREIEMESAAELDMLRDFMSVLMRVRPTG